MAPQSYYLFIRQVLNWISWFQKGWFWLFPLDKNSGFGSLNLDSCSRKWIFICQPKPKRSFCVFWDLQVIEAFRYHMEIIASAQTVAISPHSQCWAWTTSVMRSLWCMCFWGISTDICVDIGDLTHQRGHTQNNGGRHWGVEGCRLMQNFLRSPKWLQLAPLFL